MLKRFFFTSLVYMTDIESRIRATSLANITWASLKKPCKILSSVTRKPVVDRKSSDPCNQDAMTYRIKQWPVDVHLSSPTTSMMHWWPFLLPEFQNSIENLRKLSRWLRCNVEYIMTVFHEEVKLGKTYCEWVGWV